MSAFVDGQKNALSLKEFIHGLKLFNVPVNAKVCQPAGKSLLSYDKENYHFEEMARSDITHYVKMSTPVIFHSQLYLKIMHCNIPDPLIAALINEFKDPSIDTDQATAADCTNVTSPTGVATDKLPTFSHYEFEHQQAANYMTVDSNDADSTLDKDMGRDAPFNSELEPDSDADSERTDPTDTEVFF
jgi:hypothetical protein